MDENRYKYEYYDNLEPYQKQLANEELNQIDLFDKKFHTRCAYFLSIDGKKSFHKLFSDIRGPNQTKRKNNYFTHCFYLYYGKSEPQIIRSLFNICKIKNNSIILDPFCGSGTILLEANLMGINSIGFDVNPLSWLLSKVKTNVWKHEFADLKRKSKDFLNINIFQDNKYKNPQNIDDIERFFLMTYLSAISDNRYLKKNIKSAYFHNLSRFLKILEKFSQEKDKFSNFRFGKNQVYLQDSCKVLEYIKKESIDFIITSPPYLNVLDYVNNDLHALQFFQTDINKIRNIMLGDRTKSIQDYWVKMEKILKVLYEVLKSGKLLVLIVGSVRNMFKDCIIVARKKGFILKFMKKIPRMMKSGNILYEYIIILQKN